MASLHQSQKMNFVNEDLSFLRCDTQCIPIDRNKFWRAATEDGGYLWTKLHGITAQKTVILTVTAMTSLNLIQFVTASIK
jgi:hypothetical protein